VLFKKWEQTKRGLIHEDDINDVDGDDDDEMVMEKQTKARNYILLWVF
jgi:hypothetical protein